MNQNSLFLLLQTQPFPRFQKSHNHSLCFGLSKTECEWLLMTEAKIAYKNSPQVKIFISLLILTLMYTSYDVCRRLSYDVYFNT